MCNRLVPAKHFNILVQDGESLGLVPENRFIQCKHVLGLQDLGARFNLQMLQVPAGVAS